MTPINNKLTLSDVNLVARHNRIQYNSLRYVTSALNNTWQDTIIDIALHVIINISFLV